MPHTPEDMQGRADSQRETSAERQTQPAPYSLRRLKAVLIGIIVAAALILCTAGAVLIDRALQAKSDITGMTAPVYFASDGQTGRFTVDIEYTVPADEGDKPQPQAGQSEKDSGDGTDGGSDPVQGDEGEAPEGKAPEGGLPEEEMPEESGTETVSIQMTWDDAWFFEDSSADNDQLAFACKVISAAAQAQSATDEDPARTAAFMEHVFGTLGFGETETVLGDGGIGYTVATKTIMSDSGEEKFVVAVCVHGRQPETGERGATTLSSSFAGTAAENSHEQLAADIVETLTQRIGLRSSSSVALLLCGQGPNGDAAHDVADAARKASAEKPSLAPPQSIFVYASEATDQTTDEGN